MQRFKEGFTRIPPMQLLGDRLSAAVPKADTLLRDAGWLMASELLACGIDFSFAPVLDVDRSQCEVIADRSFSDKPELTALSAQYFIEGMHEAGMAATGKHFPGHGGVRADSHLETPFDHRSLGDLEEHDLIPFTRLAASLDAVMPAHIVFPAIDSDAVGFSTFWLQKMLREKLQFDGVVFSDDLSMKGADVVGGYADKARCALQAGCDMVLVCNNRQGVYDVLNYLEGSGVVPSSRLSKMSARETADWTTLVSDKRWQSTQSALSAI